MNGVLASYIGKNTFFSLVIFFTSLIISHDLSLDSFTSNPFFVLAFIVVVLFYAMIYSALIEKYELVLQVVYKVPMLKLAAVKIRYQKSKFYCLMKPHKFHDSLPLQKQSEMKISDNLIRNEKIPLLCDFFLASFTALTLLFYGLLSRKFMVISIALFSCLYFFYFLRSVYIDIENIILVDSISLFEE